MPAKDGYRPAPTDPGSPGLSVQQFLFYYILGIDFKPRIGTWFDFKLFFNGCPGIVAWTLLNLSCTAKDQELHGQVTNSTILVNVLQVNAEEEIKKAVWKLTPNKVDKNLLPWKLNYSDCCFCAPQGLSLVSQPVQLGTANAVGVLMLGWIGYHIFRVTKHQKDLFCRTDGNCRIWGKKPEDIECSSMCVDGTKYYSKLMTWGFWGWARHCNSAGDLLGSLAYCLACGFAHILPYFCIVSVTILLPHLCVREEHCCSSKYGKDWKHYTAAVPYRLIPAVF
ncbi:LOW QUALITY PROTEIN: 7-dehydrocholesterol reductase-like [Myiozetetes cayanensis]|uniref:LOW QUALITY PROTEIN: 7-dehydrocholesterol reductase-like n=1 Tax=Myiozetetes cayanensis TaxID=478635 RepID=UPI00215DDEED|nr:LOW QUALITY PROTEIN: 7-dehydrocholesterol reductase-like [Myiozetetes cayanensis]